MDAELSYARYGRALLRKAERVLQSRADAQDLVHALFLDLLKQSERTLDLAYLYRAITNRCLTFLRDERNRDRLLREHDTSLRGPMRTLLDDRTIDMDLLLKLASSLDPETTEIVIYRYLDDMTQEEIAELTGISRKTVGKKLDAAREAALRLQSPSETGQP
jgi:RNA polymerase sigma-70 factor (ECF subfamily)